MHSWKWLLGASGFVISSTSAFVSGAMQRPERKGYSIWLKTASKTFSGEMNALKTQAEQARRWWDILPQQLLLAQQVKQVRLSTQFFIEISALHCDLEKHKCEHALIFLIFFFFSFLLQTCLCFFFSPHTDAFKAFAIFIACPAAWIISH